MNKVFTLLIIIIGASSVTALAIMASDVSLGVRGNLSGSIGEVTGPCGAGETLLVLQGRTLCVDTYEAAAGAACPAAYPVTVLDTEANMSVSACLPVSTAGVLPWQNVSHTEASQLCARSGKRLLTNDEWFAAVNGLADIDVRCFVRDGEEAIVTGQSGCSSPVGVHDLVGNVWEWLDEEVVDGVWQGRSLPPTGYVRSVDTRGMVVETTDDVEFALDQDFAWTNQTGVRGVLRGGSYSNDTDGGIFTLNASVPLSFRSVGVGFRCVRELY